VTESDQEHDVAQHEEQAGTTATPHADAEPGADHGGADTGRHRADHRSGSATATTHIATAGLGATDVATAERGSTDLPTAGPQRPDPEPEDAAGTDADSQQDSATEETAATADDDTADLDVPPAVVARDLRLHGSRGPVYGPVDLELTAGALTLVQGPQGAGRSSLLLTIAGRMTPDRGGELTVLGESLPRRRNAVQKRSAVAGFDGIDDLDESVTVGDLVRERLHWLSPWYRHTGRVSQQRFAELAAPVFGERPLPRVDSVVWDLDEVDRMLLRIALAMTQHPELLVVDDVDQVHDTERRRTVWTRLEALAADGLTVIATVASLDEAARVPWSTPPQLVTLATGPHALPA
jgi:ABC-type cobalamin/Fe3+-siderophores transport system ATPase subunit